MNCICQFLYDIFPNTADKVQAWTGIFGLGAAIYAYNSWKKEKEYDLYFKLKNNAIIYAREFQFFFNTNIKRIESASSLNNDLVRSLVKSFNTFHTSLLNTEFLIDEALHNDIKKSENTEKVIRFYKDIGNFYNKIHDLIMDLKTSDELENDEIKDKIKAFYAILLSYQKKNRELVNILRGYD